MKGKGIIAVPALVLCAILGLFIALKMGSTKLYFRHVVEGGEWSHSNLNGTPPEHFWFYPDGTGEALIMNHQYEFRWWAENSRTVTLNLSCNSWRNINPPELATFKVNQNGTGCLKWDSPPDDYPVYYQFRR